MKLSPIQRRNLALYLKFKDSPPTVTQLFFFNWLRYIPLILGILAGIYLLFIPELSIAGTVFISISAGALLRDVGYFVRTVRIWPLLQHIIDWDKAKQVQDR